MIHHLFDTLVKDYIWYHAVTLTIISVICCLIVVHRRGSDINLSIAKESKAILDPVLSKTFTDYDGDLVV